MTKSMLYAWANQWGVPVEGIQALMRLMGQTQDLPSHPDTTTETGAQQRLRLSYAKTGGILWRNNVGALVDQTGRLVRYGLANESRAENTKVKSSDLIGITPVTVGGQTLGIFTAIEVKKPGWSYTGTGRELAQKRFHEIVIAHGGIARFSCGE